MNYAESILNLRREEAQGRAKDARKRERARVKAMPRYNRVLYWLIKHGQVAAGGKGWRTIEKQRWAKGMGVSPGTMSNWLRGHYPCPRMAVRYVQLKLQCKRHRVKHNALLDPKILSSPPKPQGQRQRQDI